MEQVADEPWDAGGDQMRTLLILSEKKKEVRVALTAVQMPPDAHRMDVLVTVTSVALVDLNLITRE